MKKRYNSVMFAFQLFLVSCLLYFWNIVHCFSPGSTFAHSDHARTELPTVLLSPPLTPAIVVRDEVSPFSPLDLPKRWKDFVPGMWEDPLGVDVTITWNAGDNAHKVERCEEAAHKWWKLAQLHGHKVPTNGDSFVEQDLTHFMLTFVNFCETHFVQPPKSYKARVVASRGPRSTKCPQWHLDHVPVRWVQAMVGPGVTWAEPDAVQWENINALHEADDELRDTVRERNKLLVNENLSSPHQARTGQPVLLLGRTWSKVSKDGISTPCVHKSPGGIMPWEGRVVLYMDVVE